MTGDATMKPSRDVRRLQTPDDFAAVDRLYREVFAVTDSGLNARLLTAVADNGGAVVGVLEGDRLVAFGVSLLGRTAEAGLHHYSQTVGVAPDRVGHGLGRLVKHAQRDAALADGITTMRWVFDPLQARNAHFNLDVLGGRTHELRRAYYGSAGTGLDGGEPTDRCVVEWELRADTAASPPAPEPLPTDVRPGDVVDHGDAVLVAVPASWRELRATLSPDDAAVIRERVLAALGAAFDEGRTAVSCVRSGTDVALYVLDRTPRSAA